MKNKLYLLTDVYPYGNAEKTFVEPEIEALRKSFDITVISAAPSDYYNKYRENEKSTHEDVKVIWYPGCSKALRLLCYLIFFITPQGIEEMRDIFKEGGKIFLKIKKAMFMFMEGYSINRFLRKEGILTKNSEDVFYSFWLTRLALAVVFDRKKYPGIKVISRVHGYDLYNERCRDTNRQPFKKFMDRRLDEILFISEMSRKYYIEHFATSDNTEKYTVARLGSPVVLGYEEILASRKKVDRSEFVLASCSVIIPLKRLELIIDALSLIDDIKVKWIHFGEGEDREKVAGYAEEKLGKCENISYDFKGFVNRDDICAYYAKGEVSAFITTSSTEGLPVSIMEAMACGIPIIATNVGGISEMVSDNGYLLSDNPKASEVKSAITDMAKLSNSEYETMCSSSLDIWCRDYDADKNANNVAKIMADKCCQ